MYNEKKHNMTAQQQEECVRWITYLHQLEWLRNDPEAKEYREQIDEVVQRVRTKVAKILTRS